LINKDEETRTMPSVDLEDSNNKQSEQEQVLARFQKQK
jgi:hypothetical protein